MALQDYNADQRKGDMECGVRVSYPDSQPGIRERLAGLHVDESKVKIEINTILSFPDIVAMKLAVNIIGTEDRVGGKCTGLVLEFFVHETVCVGSGPLAQGIPALQESRITTMLDLTSAFVCATCMDCWRVDFGVVMTFRVSCFATSVHESSVPSHDFCLTSHSGDGRGARKSCKEGFTHVDRM